MASPKKSRSMTTTYLHEVTRHESLANVDVIVSAAEVRAGASQVEPIHDT